jgi:hypothetical protein
MIRLFFILILSTNALLANTLYISLGAACSSSLVLRELNLRKEAYPFDWILSPHESLCQALASDFEWFLTDLALRPDSTGVIDHYGLHFVHDWPTSADSRFDALKGDFTGASRLIDNWEAYTPSVRKKYQRRISRFRNACTGNDLVCFVRTEYVNQKEALEIRDIIKNRYPELNFTLLVISTAESFHIPWGFDNILNLHGSMGDLNRMLEIFSSLPSG